MLRDLLPRRTHRLVRLLLVLTALTAVSMLPFYQVLHFRLALVWNMFLAGLPLVFALLLLWARRRRSWLPARCLLWALWLLFLPNAPYMVTDLVHITRYDYYQRGVGFLRNPVAWFGLLHLGTGILLGVLYGMLSLYLLHALVTQSRGRAAGWLFCAAACGLCGPGIYLGRFLRFNTWDIVTRPHRILLRVWETLSAQTLLLYLIFALMALIPYLVLYTLLEPGESAP